MKLIQIASKAALLLAFLIFAIETNAQSQKGPLQLANPVEDAQIGQSATPENSGIEKPTVFSQLQSKAEHLKNHSDVNVQGQNLLQLVIDNYDLPLSGFDHVSGSTKEKIQFFVTEFRPSDIMEKSFLQVYTLLLKETE